MRVFDFRREQLLPADRETVFRFFSSPENLAAITPPSVGFQILTPSPIRMKEGAVFDYTVLAFGFPVRWTTLITEYEPTRRFVDIQLKGPYSFWHHTHAFEDAPGGGTRMTDHVRYALPFGPLGEFAAPLVSRQLQNIFDFRERIVDERFPAAVRPGGREEGFPGK